MDSSFASAETLSRDEIFDLLGSEERRAVLLYLDGNGGSAPLDELVSVVERRANDGESARSGSGPARSGVSPTQSDGGSEPDDDRTAINLHHEYLPKLADAGVVDYAPSEKTARLVDGHESLFAYLYFDGETS